MKIILTLAAVAAFTIPFGLVLPAAAQSDCNLACNPIGGTGDGGGGKSYSPGEPFNPFAERVLRDQTGDGPGDVPGTNPTLPGYVAGLPLCKTELGGLSKVRARAIDKVDDGVTVVPICTRKNLMDQQAGIGSIRGAINDNEAMRQALREAGAYSANDVVAVVLDGEGAKLYVHRNRDAVGSLGSSGGGGGTDGFLRSQK